jgi:methyl-accepting chemotaxis protein
MPFDAGTVKGQIDIDARKFLATMDKIDRRLNGLEKEVKQARKGFGAFGKTIAKVAVAMAGAVASFIAIRAAVKGFVNLFRSSADAASDFELIVRKLGVSLGLAGEKDIPGAVSKLREFATEIQKTTAFSDNFVLSISQILATMGVGSEKLEEYTKAVLDYSAATGRDAVNAASQFVKTLGGSLGELSEAFPALKELTQEQLRAGEALDCAAKKLGGFSEAIAETSAGIKARLENTIGDTLKKLGLVTDPFIKEMRRAGIEIFEGLQKSIEENEEVWLGFFRDLSIKGVDAVIKLMEAVFSFRLTLHDVFTTIESLLPRLAGAFAETKLQFQELSAALPELVAKIPGAEEIFDFETMRQDIADTKVEIDGMADAFGDAEREAAKTREEMEKQHDEIRRNVIPALENVKGTLNEITEAAEEANDPVADLGSLGDDAAESIDKARQSTEELARAAIEGRQALAALAASAEGVEQSMAGAASAGRSLSRGGGDAAGGGEGGEEEDGLLLGPGFGRSAGGRAGFDLSTIGGAQAALAQTRQTQLSSVGGLYSFAARRSAGIVGKQIAGRLQQLTDQAFSDFTADILQELNRAGVFDPTQRNQILRDRISEAQRFGILPETRVAGSFVSTAVLG